MTCQFFLVRSIIAAIVDTILDGDRRKRSEIKDGKLREKKTTIYKNDHMAYYTIIKGLDDYHLQKWLSFTKMTIIYKNDHHLEK